MIKLSFFAIYIFRNLLSLLLLLNVIQDTNILVHEESSVINKKLKFCQHSQTVFFAYCFATTNELPFPPLIFLYKIKDKGRGMLFPLFLMLIQGQFRVRIGQKCPISLVRSEGARKWKRTPAPLILKKNKGWKGGRC